MRLLIITQKIDKNDSVLGFFHRWVEEFSKHYEFITVICLGKGEYDLPENVKVLSLGKELKKSRLMYTWRFFKYIWVERKKYDAVFVHMNQEYILLGWKLWKLLGKKIFLWRNHKKGDILTNFAVWVSDVVFCTSKFSYTAKFKKTKLMPVGVDSEIFRKIPEIKKNPYSILSLGRISPVKNIDLLIKALKIIDQKKQNFILNIYGAASVLNSNYFNSIKIMSEDLLKKEKVFFNGEIINKKSPVIYNQHEVFVNFTDSGSFDKTIIEAMLCGTIVLVSNDNLRGEINDRFVFSEGNINEFSLKITAILNMTTKEKDKYEKELQFYAEKHSLNNLILKLSSVLKSY